MEDKDLSVLPLIVLCTTNSRQEADKLAKGLVANKLAACVSISAPISSVYTWENKLDQQTEFMLFIKSKSDLYQQIETFIKENHSYEVPEIISWEASKVYSGYLAWLNDCVASGT
jgi:periplasmic divalent cation tolerance protein